MTLYIDTSACKIEVLSVNEVFQLYPKPKDQLWYSISILVHILVVFVYFTLCSIRSHRSAVKFLCLLLDCPVILERYAILAKILMS